MDKNPPGHDAEFYPKGALAFFALMTAAFGAAWLLMYALLLHQR